MVRLGLWWSSVGLVCIRLVSDARTFATSSSLSGGIDDSLGAAHCGNGVGVGFP